MSTFIRVCRACDELVPGERKGPGPIVAQHGERCFACAGMLTQKNVRPVDMTTAVAIRLLYLEGAR